MPFLPALDVDAGSAEPDPSGAPTLAAASDLAELRGVVGHFPDGLGALDQMYQRMVGRGRLEPTVRLVIVGASARWRSDGYVAGAMFRRAIDAGLEPDDLGRLIDEAEGPEPASPEAVLLRFCRKVTETAYKTVQSDIDALRAVGWTNGQIVEAVTMISLSGYMSVMAAAGGLAQKPPPGSEPWR